MNVYYCKYDIVREVAKDNFSMKIYEDDVDDFDIFWSDTGMQPDKL